MIKEIQKKIDRAKVNGAEIELLSDGNRTFRDLYHERMILFAALCNHNEEKAWKAKLRVDGKVVENYFVAGVETSLGNIEYPFHMENWGYFHVKQIVRVPEWGEYTADDVAKLLGVEG